MSEEAEQIPVVTTMTVDEFEEYTIVPDEETGLIPCEFYNKSPLEMFTRERLTHMIAQMEKWNLSQEVDATTQAGRAAIISRAHLFTRSKTFVDGIGKDTVSDWTQKTKEVNAERKFFRDEMDRIKTETRRLVTEFEAAEKQRVEFVTRNFQFIRDWHHSLRFDMTSPQLKTEKEMLQKIEINKEHFGDLIEESTKIKEHQLGIVTARIGKALHEEQQAAELAKLKTEAAERAKKDEEDRLRKEGEEKAKRDQEESAKQAQLAAARAKEEADQAARVAKINQEKAEEDVKLAEARHQEELKQVKAQQAAEAEQRIRNAQAEEDKRKADEQHKAAIYRDIMLSLEQHAGLYQQYAGQVYEAMAQGKIKHVSIQW